ncbi:DUF1028 domain-containing protein [Saccharopolyspora gloriosae]|uniref:Putative Ntn-hydrolase superfamily protein n=1 Tax=Saccharopolyspora gloriosae TaxID=455344 RepID=A0A840NFD1_9PSEU|nr:DUF1028 domain-containing protein [Saccharopolyspora gloriosae]MBB5070620.1 putative Ntn-hydrolase superfamily protein [Saccharopolyspora gloriosae]
MTFSVLGTDGTGAVGIAVTSSSPAVAARCIHLRAGVGGASSQNVTDPRLGSELLDALASGAGARDALAAVVEGRELIEHRQLTVLEPGGDGAVYSGAESLGVHRDRVGARVVAAGNMLRSPEVVDAVVDSFENSGGELEDRLLRALEAGSAAGGEAGPVHSAGLSVVREVAWRETDLRVDWSDDPIGDLRALLDRWLPQRDDYVTRALNPASAPSYGVPGDE